MKILFKIISESEAGEDSMDQLTSVSRKVSLVPNNKNTYVLTVNLRDIYLEFLKLFFSFWAIVVSLHYKS